jgi:hypothetical protein
MICEKRLKKITTKMLEIIYSLKSLAEEEYSEFDNFENTPVDLKYIHKWINILENQEPIMAVNEVWKDVQNITKIMDGASSPLELVKKDKLIQRLWKVALDAVAEVREIDKKEKK